jgi:hypothetical protein
MFWQHISGVEGSWSAPGRSIRSRPSRAMTMEPLKVRGNDDCHGRASAILRPEAEQLIRTT